MTPWSSCDMLWIGEVWALSELKDELKDRGSDDRICMPPYRRAAISCGDNGRDFLLSFCLRFWNQI